MGNVARIFNFLLGLIQGNPEGKRVHKVRHKSAKNYLEGGHFTQKTSRNSKPIVTPDFDAPFSIIQNKVSILAQRLEGKITSLNIETSLCPYCHTNLSPPPSRKKQCPSCKNYIYVRTVPTTRARVLATSEAIVIIDEAWSSYHSLSHWPTLLKAHNISDLDFLRAGNYLSGKMGRDAYESEVIWYLLNNLLVKSQAHQDRRMIFYHMASFLKGEGDPQYFTFLRLSAHAGLLDIKETGVIKEVKIKTVGQSACTECQKLEGKTFTIDEALSTMPIPNRSCVHDFCRCAYLPWNKDWKFN